MSYAISLTNKGFLAIADKEVQNTTFLKLCL